MMSLESCIFKIEKNIFLSITVMSEVELKLNSSVEKNDIHLIATEQPQSLLNNGMPAPPPVPIPYRGNEKSINIYSCRGENLKCAALSGLDERLNEWREKNPSINSRVMTW